VGISHNTVKSVRAELIGCGQIDHISHRLDKTGRRRQPAAKAATTKTVNGGNPAASAEARKAKHAALEAADAAGRADGPDHLVEPGEHDVDTAAAKIADAQMVNGMPAEREGTPAEREGTPNTSLPTGESVAIDFSRLVPIEIPKFLGSIPVGHHRRLEHALGRDDAAKAEIAKLARECSALLTHPEHNRDEIRKRLARIVAIADPEPMRSPKGAAKSNAEIDPTLLPRALGVIH